MSRVIRNKTLIRHLIKAGIVKSQKDLGERMGYSNASSFSQVINEKVPEPKDFIPKLKNIMPELNDEWLATGEGKMIKMPATMTVFNPSPDERQEAGAGINISVVPAELVEEIKEEAKEEIKEEMAIPVISTEIANRPNLNIRKYIDDKAGELEHIDPSDLTHQADGAERIRKTSMLPTFAPGDIVFVRFLNDKHNIIDGHTYYFDMRTRPTMIRRVKIEGDNLRLIAKNPAFGDIIVSYDDILNIADIVGLFRSSFGDQYDEIENVRRRKDEQIYNLIDEIRDSGKRTDRVMEQNYELMQKLMEKLK